jgi:hypothetical protein
MVNKKQAKTLENIKQWFSGFENACGYHRYSESIKFRLNDGTQLTLKGYYIFMDNHWLIYDEKMKIYADKDIKHVEIKSIYNNTLIIDKNV